MGCAGHVRCWITYSHTTIVQDGVSHLLVPQSKQPFLRAARNLQLGIARIGRSLTQQAALGMVSCVMYYFSCGYTVF